MVLSQEYSGTSARSGRSDLSFLSYIMCGVTFLDTVENEYCQFSRNSVFVGIVKFRPIYCALTLQKK